MMTSQKIGFGNNVGGIIEAGEFNVPFSDKDIGKYLNNYSDKINSILLAINGTKFSSNIETIDSSSYTFDSYVKLFKAGTDGLILTKLNETYKERLLGKGKIGITLGVADCASLIGSTKDGNTIFNIHAGYKGVFGNGEGGLKGGIINNLMSNLYDLRIDSGDISQINISPMAGDDFELPYNYIFEVSEDFRNYFGIKDFQKYLSKDSHLNSEKVLCKNLNLRQIIIDILLLYGLNENQIVDSGINTTDKLNNWFSYRLYSQGKQKINGRLTSSIFKTIK